MRNVLAVLLHPRLRPRDVITDVDGSPAGKWNLAGIRNVFTSEGTRHDVAVLRGTQDVMIHATIAMTPVSGLR